PGGPSATYLAGDGVKANWVIAENAKPGSPSWKISGTPAAGSIEGFADTTYAADGQSVTVYVSSSAPRFHLEAYRVGYYGGVGGRLVWRSPEMPTKRQAPCPLTPGVNMVSCANWTPSLTFPVTTDFVPGDYLLKLVGGDNEQSYVPLTVWDPTSHAAYLVKNDVFTWQAWNPYGGYDYYQGLGSCPANVYPLCSRARVVSYDRPYEFSDAGGEGTGDFLWLESPLVRFIEQHGLDVAYATDLTLVDHPSFLDNHKVLMSLGHDECWSLDERQAAVAAYDKGMNLAFFGASGVLRHVRTQPSPRGPNRELVDYRSSQDDPLNGKGNPLQVTGNTWASPPASWPETGFVGEAYNGFLEPGAPPGNLVVTDASAWIFADAGLHDGSVVPGAIASDVDSLEPSSDHPPNVQVLAHSPLPTAHAQFNSHTGGTFFSDMTYYTDPTSRAGVWDGGTNNWIPALEACTPQACPAPMMQKMTSNLLWLLGQGPAGRIRPSVANWQPVYP
ncbi:MAG TPA: N,N-dimethylformamidase beta subunit family domain-containing protein, partial [Pseudonocardiaceae bacterium]|nr:N,N-dimethylformamidase beta subunit family domain-containing protein [Pseudonocardiaceae bacterium]